jgi:MraZ protein
LEVNRVFLGTSDHSIDAKGRIVLPAKFREELGDTFYIAKGFDSPCVQVMSREQFERIIANIKELPADKARALQYAFTATAAEVSPNASGRIMIPQSLRKAAELEDEAVVLGMDTRIEIWNKSKYDEFSGSNKDVLGEAVALLRF